MVLIKAILKLFLPSRSQAEEIAKLKAEYERSASDFRDLLR